MIKNLPAKQEMGFQSLGQEDSPGEGNGNPLQYFCLEDPMGRGAWWPIVLVVAKCWKTQQQLKQWSLTILYHIPISSVYNLF